MFNLSIVYLYRSTGWEMSHISNSGSSTGVTRAYQDRGANLHGMPVTQGLGGFVCHTESCEGVALLGVLLPINMPLNGTDCSGTVQGTAMGCIYCQVNVSRQWDITARCSSEIGLVRLYKLFSWFVELNEKKKRREEVGITVLLRLPRVHILCSDDSYSVFNNTVLKDR